MWSNTPFWALLGFTIMFVLARIAMIWTHGHEKWGPLLLIAAGICFVLSMGFLFSPLFKKFSRRKLTGIIRHVTPEAKIKKVQKEDITSSTPVDKILMVVRAIVEKRAISAQGKPISIADDLGDMPVFISDSDLFGIIEKLAQEKKLRILNALIEDEWGNQRFSEIWHPNQGERRIDYIIEIDETIDKYYEDMRKKYH
jgi:hypothetical protein